MCLDLHSTEDLSASRMEEALKVAEEGRDRVERQR